MFITIMVNGKEMRVWRDRDAENYAKYNGVKRKIYETMATTATNKIIIK
jgi:hypothetical protein